MIKKFFNADMPVVSIDTEKWREYILPLLDHGKHTYRFEGNSAVQIEQVSKKMVMPLLLYALADMYELLVTSLPNENITKDLLAVKDDVAIVDDFGILEPTYNQAKIIEAYEKEVKAWLPLAVKKYVQPNRTKIKDFLSGNI